MDGALRNCAELARCAAVTARPLAALLLAFVVAGCGGGGDAQPSGPRTLRVPADYPTIAGAVAVSRPGDVVLIAPGVYHERVEVGDEHPRITIRGQDRNRVVLDGRDRLSDGIAVHADDVAVENLTVRRYQVNGIVWAPTSEYGTKTTRLLQGWRGSYITAYNNGLYGVYAFQAENGRFDHVYASGHPDSGIYVGACAPCRSVVRDSVAERNQAGYEATNAGGDLKVYDNVWRGNRVGVELNSLRKEPAFPQRGGSMLEHNTISDNNARDAPRGSAGFGAGVVVNGGSGNVIRDNIIRGHAVVGVLVQDSPDDRANDTTLNGNRLSANRTAIVRRGGRLRLPAAPPQVDYRHVAAPPPQPQMPAR
jgi:hypothetical protein